MSNRNIILAVMAGALAGAAAALLLAPGPGKQTRKKLSRSAEDAKRSVEDFFRTVEEQLGQWCKMSEETGKGSSKDAARPIKP